MGTLLYHPFSTQHIPHHLDPGQKKEFFLFREPKGLVSVYGFIYHGKIDVYIKKTLDKAATIFHTEV
jgi:hypothetical protein